MMNPFRRRSAMDVSPPAKFVGWLVLVFWAFIVLFPLYWLFVTSFKTSDTVGRGPVLHPVRRLPADPGRVAGRPGDAGLGDHPALPQHGHHRARQRRRRGAAGCDLRVCPGALPVPAAPGHHRPVHRLHGGPLHRHRAGRAVAGGAWSRRWPCSPSWPRPSAGASSGRWATTTSPSGSSRSASCRPSRWSLPLFVLYQQIGLLDTQFAIALTYVASNLPIAVWLMRDYFATLPVELEESASVDGASIYRIFRSIVLPLAVPGLVATFLIVLIFGWNEYLIANILSSANAQTMPLLIVAQDATRGPAVVDHVGARLHHDHPRGGDGHPPGALHLARPPGRRSQRLKGDPSLAGSLTITRVETFDVRFPTARAHDGSDAMNPDPDYSAAYVILHTDDPSARGSRLRVHHRRGHRDLRGRHPDPGHAPYVAGYRQDALRDMGAFSRSLIGISHLRWLGPEKGVIHLATAARPQRGLGPVRQGARRARCGGCWRA